MESDSRTRLLFSCNACLVSGKGILDSETAKSREMEKSGEEYILLAVEELLV